VVIVGKRISVTILAAGFAVKLQLLQKRYFIGAIASPPRLAAA
jgi:hypothetical protein